MQKMDRLIRMKATGCPEEFAQKLNLSRSSLMENIHEMKALGAPISYCKYRKSYYYNSDVNLVIKFEDKINAS
jgi:biotin operon repressor